MSAGLNENSDPLSCCAVVLSQYVVSSVAGADSESKPIVLTHK